MGLSTESIGDALGFIPPGIPALSHDATDLTRRCRCEARLDVPISPDTTAIQYPAGYGRGVPRQLHGDVARPNANDYNVWPTGPVARLDVAHTAIDPWIDEKRLLAWPSRTRRLTIPAVPNRGPRWVARGLGDIIDIVGNAELPWGFFTRESQFEDEAAPPLD